MRGVCANIPGRTRFVFLWPLCMWRLFMWPLFMWRRECALAEETGVLFKTDPRLAGLVR